MDDQKHKENMKELGRFGGLVVAYFAAVYLAIYANIVYSPTPVPWFLLVLIVGGFFIVPKAKTVMSLFNDKN